MVRVSIAVVVVVLWGMVSEGEEAKEKAKEMLDVRLMKKEDDAHYRKFVPRVDNKELQKILDGPLLIYTSEQMPAAYQHEGSIHSPSYNISATQPREQFGNANVEFPWGRAAGTHRCDGMIVFRFVALSGPVEWWTERLAEIQVSDVYRWEFASGTVFGEVLLIQDDKGKSYPFELRTRTKRDGKWNMDLYRPFVSREKLAEELAGEWIKLGDPKPVKVRLANRHPTKVIDAEGIADELPKMEPAVVRRLLDRPFTCLLGQTWMKDCYAPTSAESFSIVPKNYDGGCLEVSNKSCMRCHEGTLKTAGHFEGGRDWYGRVRGDDGIFSWHPFDPAYIAYNGIGNGVRFRKEFKDAGILKARK